MFLESEDLADAQPGHLIRRSSARPIHPTFERRDFDVVFHVWLSCANSDGGDAFGNLSRPRGTLNSFQSSCDGFVECVGSYARRVLNAFDPERAIGGHV